MKGVIWCALFVFAIAVGCIKVYKSSTDIDAFRDVESGRNASDDAPRNGCDKTSIAIVYIRRIPLTVRDGILRIEFGKN